MANALEDAGLAAEMARLADALRSRRPELDRAGMSGGVQMSGDEPLGLGDATTARSEEHTSELQSHVNLVCRLLLEKKKKNNNKIELDTQTRHLSRLIQTNLYINLIETPTHKL